jgi:O-glycosyl hydrolase
MSFGNDLIHSFLQFFNEPVFKKNIERQKHSVQQNTQFFPQVSNLLKKEKSITLCIRTVIIFTGQVFQ